MWWRLSALPSGQQAEICLKGSCSVDQVGSSDRCGCRCGERSHHRLLREQPGGSLQGGIVFSPVVCHCLTLFPLVSTCGKQDGGITFWFSVQVHLTAEPYVYSKAPGDTMGEKVNRNLFFDLSQSHLYITTEKKV